MENQREIDGIVKWYSKSSGYGFITSKDNIDYYFNGSDLKGIELEKKDEVLFIPVNSTKKFKAKSVKLVKKHGIVDDTVICNECKREISPELRTFEISNKNFKFIKSVEKRYECPHCNYIIGKYDEKNGNVHLLSCLMISIFSLFLIYWMYLNH